MLNSIIRKHVLKNIADYGKANPGSIIGKVIGEYPDCKTDVKGTMGKISAEIGRASKLSKEELEQEMSEFEYLVKEEKEKTITLQNAEAGAVVTRFPPEPSGYPHIGHAKAAWLDYEAAANYDGKMLLRFDDTNPEKESAEYVDAIKSGLTWLGIKWASESYTSDNMDELYKAAEKLIAGGNAYVSTSPKEKLSDSRTNSKPLPERNLSPEENLDRWKKMLSGEYKQGEALLLFKGNLESKNTVMRDPALARIIEKEHYRQGTKYIVWPSYDLSVVVMDHLEGLTHPMRSKEYELRDELYAKLFELLGWETPTMVPFSRLAIKNAPISKRLITPLVTNGKVMGWDDPRLPTVSGLKRRGLLAEAIKQFVLYFGLSRTESEPDWEVLLAFNRKLLDKEAPHYFFVPDPVKIEISGLENKEIELSMHPKKDLGMRRLNAGSTVYIPKADAEKLETGEVFRLKDLCNVKLISKGETYSCELSEDGMVPKKLQWVPDDHLECEVLIPKDLLKDGEFNPDSLEVVKGFCEKSVENLAPDSIIQFERFGFCRLDKKDPLTFIFSC
ncbi:glutamate--tRNA ligase [Candidatus Micrarchaeota archaeon]|nr:glutamate--tRNA ligase [Candidatus Micrarchaeota archaeon]MBU1682051.1 glutamate--tRNA ligase [Candidatus Micrarchaeota archaeon]